MIDDVIFYVFLMRFNVILSFFDQSWWTLSSCVITFDCSPASFVVKPFEILALRTGNGGFDTPIIIQRRSARRMRDVRAHQDWMFCLFLFRGFPSRKVRSSRVPLQE